MMSLCPVVVVAVALLTLSVGQQVQGGKFDVENGAHHIPREWKQKLDRLDLQGKMSHYVRLAKREYDMALSLEDYVLSTGIRVHQDSPSYGLYLDNMPPDSATQLDRAGQLMLKLSSQFIYSSCISEGIPLNYCARYISRLRIPEDSSIFQECSAVNNRDEDAPGHPYRRLLPADYSDGVYKMRRSSHAHQLPSPRNISSGLYKTSLENPNEVTLDTDYSPEGKLDRSRSVFFVQWSQFVEHDLAYTVQQRHNHGQPVECCKHNRVAAPRSTSSSCAPLHVSDKDPHYKKHFLNCLNYVRSAITVDPQCRLGASNQLNMASDRVDLSQVYGNGGASEEISNQLRLHREGKVKIHHDRLTTVQDHCLTQNSSCHRSVDVRVNYSPYMILQYSIFQKSHNKIAEQLKELNPQWTDDELFNAAKRINQAIIQKITYEEWLPMVVGHRMGIKIRTNDEPPTAIRGVSNEFATAAVRFYTSMMPGDLYEFPSQRKVFELRETFYQPQAINWTQEMEAKIVASTLLQKAMALDTSYVDDLNVDLFRPKNGGDRETGPFGTDALALDIMRSRDHGLAGYVHYLNACRKAQLNTDHQAAVPAVSTWEELESLFATKDLEMLQKFYHRVEDIDLIVGGIAELPQGDSLVGPTFSCIIGEQMDKSRRSDAGFYSMDHRLRETVRNYSAAKLLCDTMGINSVQADVFQIPSINGRNPVVCCEELSNGLDLKLWKSEQQQ